MTSQSLIGEQARKKLIEGAREVYSLVSKTLGARGRNIVLWKEYQTTSIHDGVHIAQAINPKDPYKNAGAEMLKQSAQVTVDNCGDGTTGTIILGYAIANEAQKIISSGVNPMGLRGALEKGRDIILQEIKKHSQEIKKESQAVEIATISSQDKTLGELIGKTLYKAGTDAVVTVEGTLSPETYVDHQEGLQIDMGYKTEYFVTDPSSMTSTLTNPSVLVTDYQLTDMHELIPLFQDALERNNVRNIVIFAEDVEGSVLATLIQNKMQGKFNSLAVKAPSFMKKEKLQDIAVMVGATFISRESQIKLQDIGYNDLGQAERITASKEATVIIGGKGEEKEIQERIASIKKQLSEEENEFQKQKLRERLAKLTGGIYVIYAGGATEVEVEDKKERIDDAVNATRSALLEGTVPGGETVYLDIPLKPENEYEEYAYRILKNALSKPFEILLSNAGLNAGEYRERLRIHPKGYGVDVTTGEIVNMREKGIIDPTKVLTECVTNAISVASAIIISDGIIIEMPDVRKK